MRRTARVMILALLSAILPDSAVIAGTDYFPNYERVRILGMGGAFTAVTDIEDAAFYNPAGLITPSEEWEGRARRRRRMHEQTYGKVSILDLAVEGSEGINDLWKDFDNIDTDNEDEIRDFLQRHKGETAQFRFMFTPGYAREHFAFYLLGNANVETRSRNQAAPVADIVGVGDAGGQISGAYDYLDGMFQIGATGRVTHRWSVVKSYTPQELIDVDFSVDNDVMTATGITFDAGGIVNFPYRPLSFAPSAGIAVKDIGSPGFGDAVGNKQDIRIGLGARRTFDAGKLTLAMDLRRVGYGSEDLSKKLYMGGEFAFKSFLSLRAGLYQGNLSAGLTLDLWLFHLLYATYAAETGAFGDQVADRRHAFQFCLSF